jgi:hypothetical protein
MDYPRAFVSFPRIAGSGNEIGSLPDDRRRDPGNEVSNKRDGFLLPGFLLLAKIRKNYFDR